MLFYYNQQFISSSLQKFFLKVSTLSLPHLKSLSYIITGMISSESVVTSDVSRKLKGPFSHILLESAERHIKRFFNSFFSIAYSFYEAFISFIISGFVVLKKVIILMLTLLTSLKRGFLSALIYSKKKIIILFFLLTVGSLILLFFLILNLSVLSIAFALSLSLLSPISILKVFFVLNILEILSL